MKHSIAIVTSFALALLAAPPIAEAQQSGKVYRIGFLSNASAEAQKLRFAAFRQGLQEVGYTVGKDIFIEERYADGRRELVAKQAAELVALGVDVIVAQGAAARAAKKTTTAIPIVMIESNPVGNGLVKSLARPGGNVTGLAANPVSIVTKRLQILKDALPSVSHVAVLSDKRSGSHGNQVKVLQAAAPSVGITLISVVVRGRGDVDRALSTLRAAKPDALIVLSSSQFRTYLKRIVGFAAKNRLPAIYSNALWVKRGGLMAYGTDVPDLFRRLAPYVDKILRGAKPAELPVQLPTKFSLVLNLKAAKALSVKFPRSTLLRATQVIE